MDFNFSLIHFYFLSKTQDGKEVWEGCFDRSQAVSVH